MDQKGLTETGRQSPEETALAQILGFAGQLLAFFSPSLGGGGPIGVGIALIAVIGKNTQFFIFCIRLSFKKYLQNFLLTFFCSSHQLCCQ